MAKQHKDVPDQSPTPETPAPTYPLRLEWIDPADLAKNPKNFRLHPDGQKTAIADLVKEVGWAGALLLNEKTGRLIDGHARKELFEGKGKVPVLVGSWDEATEAKILATLDQTASLAGKDEAKLADLLKEVTTESTAIQSMLDDLAKEAGIKTDELEGKIEEIQLQAVPQMVWMLIGVPISKFGAVREHLVALTEAADVTVQSNRDG